MWLCRYEEVWQPWDVLCHTDCLEFVVHLLKISHQLLIFSPRLAASFPQQDCSFPGALTAVCNPVAKITVMFSLCLWMRWLVCSMNRRGLSTQHWGAPVLSTTVGEVWLPTVTPGSVALSLPISFFREILLNVGLKSLYSEIGVIFKARDYRFEGSGSWILCGSIVYKCKAMRVQAGWDATIEVIATVQYSFRQDCRLSRYRDNGDCLEAGEMPAIASASWSAHVFSTQPEMFSCPAGLLIFTLSGILLTSTADTDHAKIQRAHEIL